MSIINSNFKIISTVIALMGFVTVNGAVTMEAETPPPVDEGNGVGRNNPAQAEVEAKVEGLAQEQYHMPTEVLPKELLAAIFVNLDPAELVDASLVSKSWRDVALIIMRDNLAKWRAPLFATDAEMVGNYIKMAFNNQCPKVTAPDSKKSFFQAVGTAKSNGKGKMIFKYSDKEWFMEDSEYKIGAIQGSIYVAKGGSYDKYGAANGHAILGSITFDRAEYVPGDGTLLNPKRLRCFYKGSLGGYSLDRDPITFRITTFLK